MEAGGHGLRGLQPIKNEKRKKEKGNKDQKQGKPGPKLAVNPAPNEALGYALIQELRPSSPCTPSQLLAWL